MKAGSSVAAGVVLEVQEYCFLSFFGPYFGQFYGHFFVCLLFSLFIGLFFGPTFDKILEQCAAVGGCC